MFNVKFKEEIDYKNIEFNIGEFARVLFEKFDDVNLRGINNWKSEKLVGSNVLDDGRIIYESEAGDRLYLEVVAISDNFIKVELEAKVANKLTCPGIKSLWIVERNTLNIKTEIAHEVIYMYEIVSAGIHMKKIVTCYDSDDDLKNAQSKLSLKLKEIMIRLIEEVGEDKLKELTLIVNNCKEDECAYNKIAEKIDAYAELALRV